MTALRAANLALRFALELATLATLAIWGAGVTDGPLRLVAAVAAPTAAAVAWGLVVAPRARLDAGPAARVAVELGVLGSGVAALLAAGRGAAAAVLGLLDVAHLAVYHLTDPTATSRPRRA